MLYRILATGIKKKVVRKQVHEEGSSVLRKASLWRLDLGGVAYALKLVVGTQPRRAVLVLPTRVRMKYVDA